ncbi:MAG TPA: hypothetical protein PKA41_14595 [Verrucomicrobiota bacterium]|nr:hypothetical protein [Verrucomicrobiota bacterium]
MEYIINPNGVVASAFIVGAMRLAGPPLGSANLHDADLMAEVPGIAEPIVASGILAARFCLARDNLGKVGLHAAFGVGAEQLGIGLIVHLTH